MSKKCQLYEYDVNEFSVVRNDEEYFVEHFKISEFNRKKVHWLNYHSIEKQDEIERLCEHLAIDKLTIEYIYTPQTRPKLEEYPDYIFFSIRSAIPHSAGKIKLRQEQLSFVLGEHYLISFQEQSSDHFTEVRERLEGKKGKIREKGSDFLLYRMLDAIVDNYFEVLEDISSTVEVIDQKILSATSNEKLLEIIEIQKRRLLELRKMVGPLKDISIKLENLNHKCIQRKNDHYYRDLRDNCMSIMDEIDSNKHILEGLTNLHYSIQGQRLNDIMRVLTVVSTVFIPLTFIAGIYGMNFKYMPELEYQNGYFYAMGGMIIVGVLLIVFFLRKGWLKRN